MIKKVENEKMGGLLLADPFKDIWICEIPCKFNNIHYLFNKEYKGKPHIDKIMNDVFLEINRECEEEIQKGLKYNNDNVWLSIENQQNYKMFYDYLMDGGLKPIKIKLYDFNGNAVYKMFSDIEEYKPFYFLIIEHINKTLFKYWDIKDSIIWDNYNG